MHATTWWQIAIAGMAGPVLVELAKFAVWRSGQRIAAHWQNALYRGSFVAFVLLGGVVAMLALYSEGTSVSVIHALHIGATSPLIVAAWASAESGPMKRRVPSRRTARIVQGEYEEEIRQTPLERFREAVRW